MMTRLLWQPNQPMVGLSGSNFMWFHVIWTNRIIYHFYVCRVCHNCKLQASACEFYWSKWLSHELPIICSFTSNPKTIVQGITIIALESELEWEVVTKLDKEEGGRNEKKDKWLSPLLPSLFHLLLCSHGFDLPTREHLHNRVPWHGKNLHSSLLCMAGRLRVALLSTGHWLVAFGTESQVLWTSKKATPMWIAYTSKNKLRSFNVHAYTLNELVSHVVCIVCVCRAHHG